MNIFFKINGEVVTPMLNGSILGGITCMSTIELLKKWVSLVSAESLFKRFMTHIVTENLKKFSNRYGRDYFACR